jgi:DNA-binding NtrC family response regulator
MRRVFAVLDKVVDSDVPILIQGESGTGKEVVARAIHRQGRQKDGPFVAINCAALPETLLESELFGHVKGAFTGATRDHPGLLLAARDGILLLDEIGETSPAVQAKLLRALQEREVRPVGGDKPVALGDMRLVCATNRILRDEIAAGRFREDLFYRISVVEIDLPPLRERLEDLPLIAQTFLGKLAARHGTPPRTLSRGALRKLTTYGWPGNVRQLENVLSRSAVLTHSDEIGAEDIELSPVGHVRSRAQSRDEFHKEEAVRIRAALHQHGWNVSEVARVLEIPRMSLYRKLRRHGLLTRPGSVRGIEG